MEENLNNKENAVSETAAADACAIEGAAAVPTAAVTAAPVRMVGRFIGITITPV